MNAQQDAPGPTPGEGEVSGARRTGDIASQEQIGYGAAMAEIESILRELESSAVDVDHLAERVQRASVLITLCRDRIQNARMQVDHVVAQLDPNG